MSSTVSPGPEPSADQTAVPHRQAPASAPARTSALQLSGWTIGFLVSVAVVLIGSVVPLWPGGQNLWTLSGLFLLGVGVVAPLAAAGLEIARAAGPGQDGDEPRVGSLTTDQFSHVVSWLAFAHFFLLSVTTLNPVALVGLVGAIGMLVCSPLRFLFGGRAGAARAGRPSSAGDRRDGGSGDAGGELPAGPETPEDIQASWQSAQAGWQPAGETGWYTATGRQQGSWSANEDAAPSAAQPAPGQTAPGADAPAGLSSQAAGQPSVREIDPHEQEVSAEQTVLRSELRTQIQDEDLESRPGTGPDLVGDSGADPDAELGMTRLSDRAAHGGAPAASLTATAAEASGGTPAGGSGAVGTAGLGGQPQQGEAISAESAEQATTPRGAEPAQYEAFWFAVGSPRQAVGPDGSPLFALEPGGWILALEDRGDEFLVQNTDGRTGVLRDLRDIERA